MAKLMILAGLVFRKQLRPSRWLGWNHGSCPEAIEEARRRRSVEARRDPRVLWGGGDGDLVPVSSRCPFAPMTCSRHRGGDECRGLPSRAGG